MKRHLYNVGDLVQIEDLDGWHRVVDVHIYESISEDDDGIYVTYGVVSEDDGEYYDADEEEIINSKREVQPLIKKSKRQQINELLDQMNNLRKINDLTCNAFAEEYEDIKRQLAELTKRGV
jgi:hypothetical protein